MSKKTDSNSNVETENVWQSFAQKNNLNAQQLLQFQQYYSHFISYNKLHNLTAITNLNDVLNFHFTDSLALENLLDITSLKSIADIGSGGGFPGIPLKIKYPHLSLTLIEVNNKKQEFLKEVISKLNLDNCLVSSYDWRTFLRQTNYAIDLFCARASLQPEELVRVFKASSPYKNSNLVYWASKTWLASDEVKQYILKEISYSIEDKTRKLVLLQNS